MVFSSLPVYLDPPNWSQQISNQQPTTAGTNQHTPLLPPEAELLLHPTELPGSARPVSMAERARMSKIPQPEPALKCPRCDSTNTKFCYFNNYSLSQPRHFCKTCRRYWTRGGALRNVPVGGGCRRNKRTKASTSSKSPSSAASVGSAGTGGSSAVANCGISPTILPPPQLPFMTSFHPFNEYSTNIGLSFPGVHPIDSVDYQVGSSSSSLGIEHWQLQEIQQFPFLGGLNASSAAAPPVAGHFHFGGGEGFPSSTMLLKSSSSGLISQLASVKMEDSSHGLNLQSQCLGADHENDQYWGGNGGSGSSAGNGGGGWPRDLSGFSSSTGNIL